MTEDARTARPRRRIIRTRSGWGLAEGENEPRRLRHTLAEMLAGAPLVASDDPLDGDLLPPVDRQEVWASGVTYARSLRARAEESGSSDIYDRVYAAERPELFFKSTPERVVGHGGTGTIRRDSGWDVPEPEVAVVLRADGSVFGYTIGDDLSSRSIEGENALYLPQAKVWDGACVLGPWIVPADDADPPFAIELRVRRGDETAFEGSTSTEQMVRSFEDLAAWLMRALRFPHGATLMTGTGLVPSSDFTLAPGDRVEIDVEGVGRLEHGIAFAEDGVPDTVREQTRARPLR